MATGRRMRVSQQRTHWRRTWIGPRTPTIYEHSNETSKRGMGVDAEYRMPERFWRRAGDGGESTCPGRAFRLLLQPRAIAASHLLMDFANTDTL